MNAPDVRHEPELSMPMHVNWDLLGPLLQCPNCEALELDYRGSGISCVACNEHYFIDNGIIDFIGQQHTQSPPFYANKYYRTFITNLAKIHSAHYKSGGIADFIETSIKRDLFRLVEASTEPSVDLGCGFGECFSLMGDEARIIGVDYELDLLKETRRRHPRATLVRADFAKLPFRSGSLKRIFAIAVLEHVFSLERAMEHAQRCLAPDGKFYVAVPT